MGGNVRVKVQSSKFNTTIRIEGHNEASTQSSSDSSSSEQKFRKEFTLPGPVNMGAVKSTVSSDGILAIAFPRSMYVVTPSKTASSNSDRVTFPRDYDDTSQWELNLRK